MFSKLIPLTTLALLPFCISTLAANEPGSINRSIQQIRRFAPDDADLLIVARPKRLMNSIFFKTAASMNPRQVKQFYPAKMDEIELILALTSTNEVFPQPPAEPVIEPGEHPAISSISNKYVGLIRLDSPVSAATLIDWFSQQPERLGLEAYIETPKFKKAKWNGHEVYFSPKSSVPAIHQIDHRTFVIANPELMRKRLTKPSQTKSPIDAWLKSPRLSGDLVIAADLKTIKTATAPIHSGMPLEHVQSAGIQLDFSGPELLALRCQLNKAEHAHQLLQTFESYRQLGIASVAAHRKRARSDEEKWLVDQAVPILRSFKTDTQGSTVKISLPRPRNFDGLVAKFAATVVETRRNYESQMNESFSNLQTQKVLVIKRQMSRGETIQARDILIEEWPVDRVPQSAFTTAADVVGGKAKREIYPGEPLLLDNVHQKSATVPVAKP